MKSPRYPEKRLQQEATNWLRREGGYRELLTDEEARGDRVDSVGLLRGQLDLIEVKVSVHASLIDHHPDRPQSLEAKIAGALGPLYRGEDDQVSRAANAVWTRDRPPLIAILAQSFSGLPDLIRMVQRRSAEWVFDAEVWQWMGERLQVLSSSATPPPALDAYANCSIPPLIGRSNRAKARSLEDLRLLAGEREVGDLLDRFLARAQSRGLRIKTGRWTIGFQRPVDGLASPQTVLGVYLDAAAPGALSVGCACEMFGIDPLLLPGTPPGGRQPGFLNTNRVLRSLEEIDALFAAITSNAMPA